MAKCPYSVILRLETDTDFRERLRVAATIFGVDDPAGWTRENALKVALLDDVNSKYAYCLQNSPYHSRPGLDPAVIPDELLATAVGEVMAGR